MHFEKVVLNKTKLNNRSTLKLKISRPQTIFLDDDTVVFRDSLCSVADDFEINQKRETTKLLDFCATNSGLTYQHKFEMKVQSLTRAPRVRLKKILHDRRTLFRIFSIVSNFEYE